MSWGAPGKTAPGEFHVPHGIWVHTDVDAYRCHFSFPHWDRIG
jgi:hypothetical protein